MSGEFENTASRGHRALVPVLLAALVAVGWVYRSTLASMVEKWAGSEAFSQGFLILPISLWLVWRKRAELATVQWRPSWLGVAALAAATVIWVVARGTGVLVVEQFAVVAMVPALLLAILGWRAVEILAFPLAFLIFAVPFGQGLIPWLMQLTASIATSALSLSGVPIYRSYMHISIPSGTFEIARACSGLNYSIAGLALGMLYAHLTYSGWRKRLLCVAAFIVIPIVANGLRVYVTIAVSHLTDMRFGPGHEHVTFGKVLFIVVVFGMFWIGRRWHDDPRVAEQGEPTVPVRPVPRLAWGAVPLALLVPLAGPPYLAASIAKAGAELAEAGSLVALPAGASGWTGPEREPDAWRPHYLDALADQSATYRDAARSKVDVYVGVYGLGVTQGAEMISYTNRIFAAEDRSLAPESIRRVPLADGGTLRVREQTVNDSSGDHVVWYWYMVGPREASSKYSAKVLEGAAFVMRSAALERVITLSTPHDDESRQRLQSFVTAHEACLRSGFVARACGG